MAANFDGATQFVSNSAATIAIPFAVCAWINDGGGAHTAFSVTNSASDSNLVLLAPTSPAAMTVFDGTGINQFGSIPTPTNWIFACLRAISTTNFRLDVLNEDGSTLHDQGTSACNPTGLNCVTIGGYNVLTGGFTDPFLGSVAEFWYTNADLQADGGVLDDSLLRQIAYGGPFSVPHIAASVVDYRSLRQAIGSDQDSVDAFNSRYGRQSWVNTGNTPLAPHPPLPYWYVRPGQTKTQLVI